MIDLVFHAWNRNPIEKWKQTPKNGASGCSRAVLCGGCANGDRHRQGRRINVSPSASSSFIVSLSDQIGYE
jgi:hypothetical protein